MWNEFVKGWNDARWSWLVFLWLFPISLIVAIIYDTVAGRVPKWAAEELLLIVFPMFLGFVLGRWSKK